MKSRILRKTRGKIRFFRNDYGESIWRFAAGKMERIRYASENYEWSESVRLPHKIYESGWREIKPYEAKRKFPRAFIVNNPF